MELPLPDSLCVRSLLSSLDRLKTWAMINDAMEITEFGTMVLQNSRMKLDIQEQMVFLCVFIFNVLPMLCLLLILVICHIF